MDITDFIFNSTEEELKDRLIGKIIIAIRNNGQVLHLGKIGLVYIKYDSYVINRISFLNTTKTRFFMFEDAYEANLFSVLNDGQRLEFLED